MDKFQKHNPSEKYTQNNTYYTTLWIKTETTVVAFGKEERMRTGERHESSFYGAGTILS